MWWLLLTLLPDPALGAPAHPGSARAQLQQLDEELRRLVEKNAWGGVERTYVQMAALQARGVSLTWEQHQWGALAAQARGDVLATWQRLRAAEAVESRAETLMWLATLEATHGRAVVELSPLVFGEVTVESLDPVADPAAQRTIERASRTLSDTRAFDGLLPLGRYRIGTVRFDIDGGPLVRVRVDPGQAKAKPAPAPPGTVRLVAVALPETQGDLDRALDTAREAAAAAPGVASAAVVPLPGRRLYADFGQGSLDMLGLTATEVATQVRAALGVRDVLPGPDAISVPVAVGEDRLKTAPVTFDGGAVTVGDIARLREAPDRTAPPPGLLLSLAPGADPAAVQAAVLERTAGSPLQLSTP